MVKVVVCRKEAVLGTSVGLLRSMQPATISTQVFESGPIMGWTTTSAARIAAPRFRRGRAGTLGRSPMSISMVSLTCRGTAWRRRDQGLALRDIVSYRQQHGRRGRNGVRRERRGVPIPASPRESTFALTPASGRRPQRTSGRRVITWRASSSRLSIVSISMTCWLSSCAASGQSCVCSRGLGG